jgi:hypothetical protein
VTILKNGGSIRLHHEQAFIFFFSYGRCHKRQGGISACFFFDNVVLVDGSRMRVNHKLELWRWILKIKSFMFNISKKSI